MTRPNTERRELAERLEALAEPLAHPDRAPQTAEVMREAAAALADQRQELWDCFVASGADPDGDDSRHLNPGEARRAVEELRADYEEGGKIDAEDFRRTRKERDFLLARTIDGNSDWVGRSSNELIRCAVNGDRPNHIWPLDREDLARCEETYERAPRHLQRRMEPTLNEFRAYVAGRRS